eukprot:GHUV01036793.1.p1 GENE.GHUV01036793.1~~GHUV01036793.1.p1  ORF type:complete len:149 (+),score=23.02 GHUV01036793.1:187-633(+)
MRGLQGQHGLQAGGAAAAAAAAGHYARWPLLPPCCPCSVRTHPLLQSGGRSGLSGQRAADNESQALDSLDLEIAVPKGQRPANELAALKQTWLYSWAILPVDEYIKRLAVVFTFFFTLLGCPIANQTFDFTKQVSCIHQNGNSALQSI